MSKVNIVMDISQFDLFRLCEQRYYLRHERLVEPEQKSGSLDAGTLIHLACETYYDALKAQAKYEFAVNSALMKLKAAAAINEQLSLSAEEVSHVIDTMEQYFDHWRVADQNLEILEVEKPFMYLLYEDEEVRIYMTGKIDLITRDNTYPILPYDHKSFSRSGPVEVMSNQFKNYCNALNVNILLVNRIGLQKTLKPHEKFLRVPVTYDHLKIAQWKNNTIKVIMENYLNCKANNYWPTNETSCLKFNRQCEYYQICDSSGEESKEFKILNFYKKAEPWDVTKSLKKTSEQFEDLKNETSDKHT